MQRLFLDFEEVAQAMGVSVKLLRSSLARDGLLRLKNTPPIRTVKIGHLRRVPVVELTSWLSAMGAASAPPGPEQGQDVPRRGRPRKGGPGAGA